MVDFDAFEERAAIMQFDGGLSRFDAETQAAKAQGLTRWQMLDAINANRIGNPSQGGNNRQAHVGNRQDHVSGMQSASQEQDRAMSQRHVLAGRGGMEMLALRNGGRGVL